MTERWLSDLHMAASDIVTAYICDGAYLIGGEQPDPADVHEDVREDLQRIFDQIAEKVPS